jgi:hypothetical protein
MLKGLPLPGRVRPCSHEMAVQSVAGLSIRGKVRYEIRDGACLSILPFLTGVGGCEVVGGSRILPSWQRIRVHARTPSFPKRHTRRITGPRYPFVKCDNS